jgi:hypothetical protein
MSIQRITKDNIENFTLQTYPSRTYVSSSSGITGSVLLFARENRIIKDAVPNEDYAATAFDTQQLEEIRRSAIGLSTSSVNIEGGLLQYMSAVNTAPPSAAYNKRLEVTKFSPSAKFTKDTLRKSVTKNVLFPFYRPLYSNLNWCFTNYHSINFFTASSVPSDSALIYPAGSGSALSTTVDPFPYSPTGSFTFEFYINPRYKTTSTDSEFRAGSILHLSSSYCLSLITGTHRDINGIVDTYKVMLQLSHSADIPPSTIAAGGTGFTTSLGAGYMPDLVFTSSDIPWNEWTHVAVRWEATSTGLVENANKHTGSFVINGMLDKMFVVQSSSLVPQNFTNPQGDPDALFVGNYYDGPNNSSLAGTPLIARFFNAWRSYHDGIANYYPTTFVDDTTAYQPPGSSPDYSDIDSSIFNLSHPLNAEIHDVRIYNRCKTIGEIKEDMAAGPTSIDESLIFYLPVFFVRESPVRDVLQTPFKSVRTNTDDPFNVALSFGVAGRQINLPNFVREFVQKQYPRLYSLTGSEITTTTTADTANNFLYQQPSLVKGNLTILPNDNGKFSPNFNLLRTGSDPDLSPPKSGTLTDKFQSDDGALRYDLVSLNDLVLTSSYLSKIFPFDAVALPSPESIAYELQGAPPEDPGLEKGPLLTVLDRTRDPSSNEVTFFDVSNLFYGRRIMPESFNLFDTSLTGSNGRVSMRILDNGNGNLYRADSLSQHATWSTVGSIIYDEGIAVVTDPTAMLYGKDQFELTMQGERPVFVKEINVLAPAGSVNSSSNPNWIPLKPSDNENENAGKFVYISHVNLHDDNLNIIGKATFAQPLVKRDDDKFLIRLKIDY